MSYEGKNIVKNSVTLNEVTKANADLLPNRDGKILNVDGELYKDDGSKLVKVVNNDSKATRWGLVYRGNTIASEWDVTGDASVADNSFEGSTGPSFTLNTGTAGDTVEIEQVIPGGAIDTRYNQATVQYILFDIDDPVLMEVLDWNDNVIGSVSLPKTGSQPALADNIRFNNVKVDFTFPYIHGAPERSIKYRFSSAGDILTGGFYVNFIQSDSDPMCIGQYVEVNSVERSGNSGDILIGINQIIPFENDDGAGGKGYNETTNRYKVQRTGALFELEGMVSISIAVAMEVGIYRNGTLVKVISGNASETDKAFSYRTTQFVAGDIIDVRASISVTVVNNSAHFIRITETANHQGVVKEGELLDQEKILASNITSTQFMSDLTVSNLTAGKEYEVELSMNSLFNSSSNVVMSFYNSNESTGSGFIQSKRFGNDSTASGVYAPIEGVVRFTAENSFFSINAVISGSGTIYGDGGKTETGSFIKIKEVGNGDLLIPNHVTRLNGQEYPVMGEYVELADGTRYQVYERAYLVTSANQTLATGLPTTIRPVTTQLISGTQYYFRYTERAAAQTGVSFNISTGDIVTLESTWTIVGTVQPLHYYDTARPL